jgi:hypothetical protein
VKCHGHTYKFYLSHVFFMALLNMRCLKILSSSSVSIVPDYGLYNRAIGVRSPAEEKDFSSSLCVQTSSGAHPASCPIDTEGPFPGGEARPRHDADHSPPSSAKVVNE